MEMCCDLQGTLGTSQKIKLTTKIWKFPPNEYMYPAGDFLVGFAGNVDEIMEAVDFYGNPESYSKPPKYTSSGVVLTSAGGIYYFSSLGKWLRVRDKVHAIGSGAPTAMGALLTGASAKEAILAATKVDPFTGMGTKVYKL